MDAEARAGSSDRPAGTAGRQGADEPSRKAAKRLGRKAAGSPAFGAMVTGGLIVYGGVHLVIAALFLQVAWSPGGGSGQRPITALSRTVPGQLVLWAAAVGMALLVLWRLAQVVLRPTEHDRRQGLGSTVTWLFEAAIYVLIAISAVQAAVTRGRRGSVSGEGQSERSLGATLLAHVWGRAIVIAIAVALFALGIQLFRSAVTQSFADELTPDVRRPVIWAGAAGAVVKGIALVIISGLLVWAAVTFDASKTAGLEAMIQTLRDESFGPALLTVMGAGLAIYGCYCFAWSAHARR